MNPPTHTLVTGYRKYPGDPFVLLPEPVRIEATGYTEVMSAFTRNLPFVPYSLAAWHVRGEQRIAGVVYANGEVTGRPAL